MDLRFIPAVPKLASERARSWLPLAAKAIVTALLFYLVMSAVDISAVADRLETMSWVIVIPFLAVLFVQTLVAAARWQAVVGVMGMRIRYPRAWLIFLIGLFFNQSLPSTIGGDVVRTWRMHLEGHGLGLSASSVLVDRVVALVGILVMIAAALPWIHGMADAAGRGPAVLSMAAALLLAAIAVAIFFGSPRLPAGLTRWRAFQVVDTLMVGARALIRRPGKSLLVLSMAVIVHTISALSVYLLALGSHIEVSFGHCLALVPAVILISTLPVSIAGWGVREGAMVTAFGLAGVAASDALLLSVGFGLGNIVIGLPGGVIWLLTGGRRSGSLTSRA